MVHSKLFLKFTAKMMNHKARSLKLNEWSYFFKLTFLVQRRKFPLEVSNVTYFNFSIQYRLQSHKYYTVFWFKIQKCSPFNQQETTEGETSTGGYYWGALHNTGVFFHLLNATRHTDLKEGRVYYSPGRQTSILSNGLVLSQ